MRIKSFSEARGIFESEEFSLEPHIYCFGGGGDNGGGGDSMDDDPDGDFDALGGSAGDFEGTNFGGDTATAGGSLGGGGDSNDNDGDGIPNSIDATPGTPSGTGDAFDSVGAAYDEAVASIAAGEDVFGPGGAAGYGGGDDDSAPDIGDTSPPPAPAPSDADNDGIPDTIDIDAGTGTGTPVDGVDIFDPGFDDTDLADTIEIAPPEVPDPGKVADLLTEIARDQQTGNIFSVGPESTVQGPPADAQDLGVLDNTYAPDQGRVVSETFLGPAPETKTLGESLIDDLFEELNPGPESFTPESLTPGTNVLPTGTNQFQEQPEDQAIYGGRSIASPQVATLTDAERSSQQGIDAEMTGIPIEATAERKEIAGQDPRAPDYTLAEAQANLEAARAEAYKDKQFGFDTGLPSSINVFGANVPTGIGVVEGIADALFDPESSLANAIAERGIKSVDGKSAEGTANYNPNGLEVVTTGTPVTEGGRAAAYDPNNNVVYDTDPFSGVNPFGEERVPENIQNLYSKKNAIDDAERARQGDGGDARQAQTTEPDITCPEGFEYDPVSDSCVVKEPAPRIYGGPASVNIATPTLTQYTQMPAYGPQSFAPTPIPRQQANITPVQLVAPRPVDPLTGRPFAKGGIVNAAKFHEGGTVDLAEQTMQSIVGNTEKQDWMDVNKDGKVNISDSVQLLKVGAGVAEQDPNAQVTSNDLNYLKGLTEAGLIDIADFIGAIRNYVGTGKDEDLSLSSSVSNALANRDMLTGQSFANYLSPEQIDERFGTYVDPTQFQGYVDPTTYAQTTGQLSDLQAQLAGMEGYVDPSQFEGYVDPTAYAQATGQVETLQGQLAGMEGYVDPSQFEGYVDPTTYAQTTGQVETLQGQLTGLQGQLDQKVADYDALSKTYGTSQADLDRAAAEIQQLQSTIGDLQGQQESTRQQAVAQQYGQRPDYSQYTQPAQSFMPQAAQTTPYTQFAPPAGIAGLQPTLAPTLASPQFIQQPTLDIPMLELAELDPFMATPYTPPGLYNPFVPPSQNFRR